MTKNWQTIIGHVDIVDRLQSMLQGGRRPHAFLFSGPNGIGKGVVAEVFATALLCQGSLKPCGVCPACRQMATTSHPDYRKIVADGASIKIEQIRGLQREVGLASYCGGCRVVVIDGAELMTVPSANSLLKTLEEPVGDIVFILLTSARQSLLPTVLSRCMQFSFHSLGLTEVEAFLRTQGVDASLAATATRLSGGRLGRALALVEPEGLLYRDDALDWLGRLRDDGLPAAWSIASQWDKAERPVFLTQLEGIAVCLRDLMVLTVAADSQLVVNVDRQSFLHALLPRWREDTLAKAWQAVEQARRAIMANANLRLTGESLLIRLQDLME